MNYPPNTTVANFGSVERFSQRRVRQFAAMMLLRLAYFLYRGTILAGVVVPPALLVNWIVRALLR